MTNEGEKVHTKTHIYKTLNTELYTAEPVKRIVAHDKQRARTVSMAQNGMLEFGTNMKCTISEISPECNAACSLCLKSVFQTLNLLSRAEICPPTLESTFNDLNQ